MKINEKTGIWMDKILPSTVNHEDSLHPHKIDIELRNIILILFEEFETFVDFGCGNADYAKELSKLGKKIKAYDGNPFTEEMTNGFASVLDLSKEFDLNEKFDVVICLEVGEHIPKKYEQIFLNNLANHAKYYILLSWALPKQGGDGHVNEQTNKYIINEMKKRNFIYLQIHSDYIREIVNLWWFKNTIMLFKREDKK